MLQSREPVSATPAMSEGEVQVCSPSGRGVSLISESRRDIWVSGIPVKSGGALLAEDWFSWSRTRPVQIDITRTSYCFHRLRQDMFGSNHVRGALNNRGTLRSVSSTCRPIVELACSSSLRKALSSISKFLFCCDICIRGELRAGKDISATLVMNSLQAALDRTCFTNGWNDRLTGPARPILWVHHFTSAPASLQFTKLSSRFHGFPQTSQRFSASHSEFLTVLTHDSLDFSRTTMILFILDNSWCVRSTN
mmetsp:Transcript_12611/g.49121  ORF Transcript_12611/g.49121 Transcript_12611/m.49121 type:complete len:251 (-) Transcript_12611:1601-2353(-)